MRVEIKVTGIVQGVGFRPFIYRLAILYNLKGFVRNRGDAGVEITVEGKKEKIEKFINDLENNPPSIANIQKVIKHYHEKEKGFTEFKIHKSSETKELEGSVIPPDIAICQKCLEELRNPKNARYDYFFITCTGCGPRYTTIQQLPYDRHNTTMQEFEMCEFCRNEYADPTNRRFHAQTVACPNCGPKAYLAEKNGQPIKHKDPIREAGRLLEEGYILAIKGYGGFHVATATTQDDSILRLRKEKHRAQKPFAIMARDLKNIRSFAKFNPKEAELLRSPEKPILLLNKAEDFQLSQYIAPGLHNIGVMLPYTGLHMMLFDLTKEPAFVMTSANPPSEPIVTDHVKAIESLGSIVDYFLFHNRAISQRCDDSVLRLHDESPSFIRRSRGFAPAPIILKKKLKKCVLGVGAEENVTACILHHNKAFVSQYIGTVRNLETLTFMKETVSHLLNITNTRLDAVACDLHPKFSTTRFAKEIAEEVRCPIFPIQHHHAHMLSLMGEHDLDDIIGIVCDGYGYGAQGNAWGGEVFLCSKGECHRIGNMEAQPLLGGDLATQYPIRMVAGILGNSMNIESWLLSKSRYLAHGEKEAQIIIKQLKNKESAPTTTSCGRILDALSAILGICYERTYQGEPAMKLESIGEKGYDVLKLEPKIKNGILNTTSLISAVFEAKDEIRAQDLAYSAQSYVARGLFQLAADASQKFGIKTIGFSGGVAYNKQITLTIERYAKNNALEFYIPKTLPAGDGGISFGQAIAVASSKG
ncbi:MAG: carbamoyltransferase HypF [Candidatus Bathyarchaeota archaeon]|nr:MAG: carbamoyltransferase HypF [Candidatus Bathyarchaeota archaeon]